MTLKMTINGTNKRLITPLRTFVNGQLVRLSKGFTFINGERVQLWGNTRTEFFGISYDLGYDNVNLYIDDDNYYCHGTALTLVYAQSSSSGGIPRTSITPSMGGGGYWTRVAQSNCLTTFTITNPSNATEDGYSQWGANPMFNPEESDDENYIYYLTNGTTRNKVKIAKGNGISVIGTYTVPVSASWCVPLANGNNMWGRSYTSSGVTYYQLGYNGTTISSVYSSQISNPVYDGGNRVLCGTGYSLYIDSMNGSSQITNHTYITSKILDGDYAFVAGYNYTPSSTGSATRIARYNVTNDTTEWEVVFSDDRRPDIIGEGDGKYYVVDKPKDYEVADQDVYLRVYEKNSGTELSTIVINYETITGSRIIDWKTFPVKAKNGILSMRSGPTSGKLYLCKIFVD